MSPTAIIFHLLVLCAGAFPNGDGVFDDLLQEIPMHRYFQETVSLPSSVRPVEIIYGNDIYGYFRTKNFKWSFSQVVIEFTPPGRSVPLHFFLIDEAGHCEHKIHLLEKNVFVAELQEKIVVQREGRLVSSPFLAIMGTYLIKGIPTHLIINRIGEIVMILPYRSGVLRVRPDGWALLRNKRLDFLTYEGAIRKTLNLVSYLDRDILWYSHDFFFSAGDDITVIANKKKKMLIPPLNIILSLNTWELIRSTLASLFTDLFFLRTNEVHRIDKYGRVSGVWDSTKFLSPFLQPSESLTQQVWRSAVEGVGNDSGRKPFEFLHMNSLSEDISGQLLISLRDRNELVLISSDWRNIIKRISTLRYRGNVYRLNRQHDVHFLEDGIRVMLFNNNPGVGRSSEIIVFNLANQEVLLRYSTGLTTFKHGSVVSTGNKTIIYSAPNDVDFSEHIGELSMNGDLLGKISLRSDGVGRDLSYKVLPLAKINENHFLGFEKSFFCKNI